MTERAVGYGRKSFDDPDCRTSSVDDQRAAAEAYAAAHGFELVAFHGDDGITGATMERPGLQRALAAIVRGGVKILIIEDVDRLGRDQEHLQHMAKIFRLHSVALHTVAAGPIDELVFSFKGIIGEQQRMRIAYTTRRGLKGKAKRGGFIGGRTLGYAREVTGHDANGRPTDKLAIVPAEAELVRRIFQLYADGNSLKKVCSILNEAGVPSPRARETGPYSAGVWNPTTLSGDPSMGEGILNNETYVGRQIFNRRKWIEVPNDNRSFSRRPRLNPEGEWIVRDEPHLRIVEQELWDQVKVRQQAQREARDQRFRLTGRKLAGGREAGHLLSGLVECGKCGRPFIGSGGGRWRCKGVRADVCDNGSITSEMLESRALVGLQEKMLTPDRLERFAAMLEQELKAAWRDSHAARSDLEAKLSKARSGIANIVAQVEEQGELPRSLSRRLLELEREEEAVVAELGEALPEPVVRLPTNYAAVYRRAVADLGGTLDGEDAAGLRTKLRTLITKVVVGEGNARGGRTRTMRLEGDLFRMLEFADEAVTNSTAQKTRRFRDEPVVLGMVAGTGFEPVTFRL